MKNRITIEPRSRPIQDGPFHGTAHYRVVLIDGRATLAAEVRNGGYTVEAVR